MNALPLLIAAVLGVDVGWRPAEDGGWEYTVQMEPQWLSTLKPGGDVLTSEVPAGHRDIRRFRIVVGTEQLARTELPPVSPSAPTDPNVRPASAEQVVGPRFPGEPSPTPATPASEPPALTSKEAVLATSAPPSDTSLPVVKPTDQEPPRRVAGFPPEEPSAVSTGPPAPFNVADWPHFATAIGLFASVGANIFLGWILWGAYRRNRTLARRAMAIS